MVSTLTFAVLLVGAIQVALGVNGHPRLPGRAKRGGASDATDGRLPQNFRPCHYNLELRPDIYQETPPFNFSGNVQIYFKCVKASNVVIINSKDLVIDDSSVKISLIPGQDGGLIDPILSSWDTDPETEFLSVTTMASLTPNASYILKMNFTGIIGNNQYGLYYDYYTSADGIIKYLAATQFEVHGGRQAFPCFDEPGFKATFKTTIVRKPPAVSVANTLLLKTIDRGYGWVADVYDTTPKMSVYLVAFVVGEFEKLRAKFGHNEYEINIWARSEIVPLLNFSLSTAPVIQAWLEEETGITYKEAKSDHLAIPNKGGAMENWGLIMYGEEVLAVRAKTSSAYGVQLMASIIAHEVAHLWYGDLVTCKWWDDLWLNEGFANYYSYRPTQVLGWEGSEASQVDIQNFLEEDQRNSSDPVRKSILNPSDAWKAFSGSTYPKGGAMVRQLEGILTTPTFKAGLTKYLQKYKYKSVTTDDLWRVLTKQAAIDGITNPDGSALDVKLRMDPWVNQMGFPLVSVTRHKNGTATLTRSHFLRPPNQIINTPSPYNYEWDVPITIVSIDSELEDWDAAPTAWIDRGVSEVTISGFPTDIAMWAVINAKFSFFYRVKYDDDSHDTIVRQLLLDHTVIHVESRSQFIDDAFSVSRAGYMPEAKAMDTTLYLTNEENWGPWNAALKHLKYSDRLLRKHHLGGLQREYILSLALPVHYRHGWTYDISETPMQKFLTRDMISLTCSFGHAYCLTEARSQYKRFVSNPDGNVLDPNNLPTVLCVGVYEGTEADWQLSFDQYLARQNSQIPEERYAYLFGSACTNDNALLDRLLVALETSVASRDRNFLAQYLSQSDYGAKILWDYLDVNWENDTSGIDRMTHLKHIALGFSTQEELEKLLAFKGRHPPAPNSTEANSYTNLILDIETNIDWFQREGPGLQRFFSEHRRAEEPVEMVDGPAIGKRNQPMEPSMDYWQAVHKDSRWGPNRF